MDSKNERIAKCAEELSANAAKVSAKAAEVAGKAEINAQKEAAAEKIAEASLLF